MAAQLYAEALEEGRAGLHAEVAESGKLLENIFRSVNIALVNELKIVFDKMGIDVWEVIEAAKTKPFGFMPFYPGPGLGGHCIPIDPFYLTWKAPEEVGKSRFIELAGEINTSMPHYVVDEPSRPSTTRARASRAPGSSSSASPTRPTSTTTAKARATSSSSCSELSAPKSPAVIRTSTCTTENKEARPWLTSVQVLSRGAHAGTRTRSW